MRSEKKRTINFESDNLFSGRIKEIGIISIILIVVTTYGLFFYQENTTEQNIRQSLFVQQRDRQIESTKAMAQHISSELASVMSILQGLADSAYLQQSELYGDRLEKLMNERFGQINAITKVDGLFVADKDDIITYDIVAHGQRSFVNIDISFRDYVQELRNTLRPTYSNGFEGIDGIYRIALTFPIMNRESGQYIGMVGVEIPSIEFFAHYGNVYNVNSKFLVSFDGNGTMLANGASHSLVGKNFFGRETQQFINSNEILNNLTRNLLAGKSHYALYDYGRGERITTDYPIFLQNMPKYFIQVITPTSQIYSHINEVLFTERSKIFSLIAGTTAAIVVLVVFLIKWNNTLNKEVKRRTRELEESNTQLSLSNKKLALANEQLKVHDRMQKEFINVASHEMKTPTQAILGFSQILQTHPEKSEEIIHGIKRNATRLQRLTYDILDVAKIDSQSLKLNIERFNLNELISNILEDYRNQINNANVLLLYNPEKMSDDASSIFVEADKSRLSQVIYNLLSNASKFTKEGAISISVKKSIKGKKEAIVSIKDTGTGIHPEIFPKLFSKFVTKSDTEGTGLGLYISKNIIEAHGGKMWAENNNAYDVKGRGSIFRFSIPLNNNNNNNTKDYLNEKGTADKTDNRPMR